MAESSDFYRKSYERMLREFTRLEDHDLRLVKLFKLTVSRTLIAVEKAYPSLVPLCNRIRGHVSRQADADFPLDRLQVDIEQLSQRLRELESGRDNAAPADEKPDNSRAEYQRKLFVREFVPQMLEGIAFIGPLESHRRQLLDAIAAHQFDAHPSLVIDRTVALINEMRQMIEQEKTELTLFLDEIKASVQRIEEDAFHQGKQAEERRGKLRRFDNMLGRSVGKLKKQIEEAEDIDTIKQTVRDQIEQLHGKVREFHETEGRRLAEFESQNLRLRGYLTTVIKRAQMQENKLKEQCGDRNRCTLTALPNAFAFEQQLRNEVARLRPGRPPLSMLFVDIDHLKKVAKSHGQQTADKILIVLVQTISRMIHYSDYFARIGPDEFAILTKEQDGDAALELAEAIRTRVMRTRLRHGSKSLSLTLSCGVTELEIGQTSEEAYRHALEALQHAKAQGGNRCQRIGPT
ncbi:diguanylate cyclase [Guyparkeria sp. SCN-R1]|uniref:GGDEF domain-containing protein n=1 Tax=Guyparkeria sp. SCN-R1 TaxID=2341113 RepID=UPI000F64B86B|nr:GGDEF domain-containing protein [Guyparkeria sp. SCN-R1]RRQ24777.1 diguanylate cyclase [Guyparkeria sp. SCN-R1]